MLVDPGGDEWSAQPSASQDVVKRPSVVAPSVSRARKATMVAISSSGKTKEISSIPTSFCSPTGIQPIEDLLPLVEHNPDRFRLVANVNPAVHADPAAEASRQLGLGAVAVKLHPVHGAFRPGAVSLYPVYDLCAGRGVPVIVHTGGSIFPGSEPEAGDPGLMRQVIADFPGVTVVLAHGGRGHWYADAAALALAGPNVWIDLAGLPPKRLPDYYAGFDLPRLARKWIFGTDWPGVPGVAGNARALIALGLPGDVLAGVLSGNAARVYLRD